jgi:hypothetical protein
MAPTKPHTSIWATIAKILLAFVTANFVSMAVLLAAGFLGAPPILVYAVYAVSWIGVFWWMFIRLRRKSPDIPETGRESTVHPVISPEYAFSEHLMIPIEHKHADLSSVRLLAEAIDKALIVAPVEGCGLYSISGKNNSTTLALGGFDERLFIWASIQSEVTRFKITVYYAERNKGRWRGKHETNWNFENSRSEAIRVTNTSTFDQDLVALAVLAAAGPKLSVPLAEYANGMRQSFLASISQALNDWQNSPEPNRPPVHGANSAQSINSGRVRD